MKIKFITLALVSTAFVACKDEHKIKKASTPEITKVAVVTPKKKYDSISTLSDNAFIPDRVFFKFDDTAIQDEYASDLKIQAAYLKAKILENPKLQVVVEGYCDERGGVEYNMALGLKRANAAKKFLVAQGVPAKNIKTTSFGKERKLVDGVNAVAYLQNRAAVTKISK